MLHAQHTPATPPDMPVVRRFLGLYGQQPCVVSRTLPNAALLAACACVLYGRGALCQHANTPTRQHANTPTRQHADATPSYTNQRRSVVVGARKHQPRVALPLLRYARSKKNVSIITVTAITLCSCGMSDNDVRTGRSREQPHSRTVDTLTRLHKRTVESPKRSKTAFINESFPPRTGRRGVAASVPPPAVSAMLLVVVAARSCRIFPSVVKYISTGCTT